MSVWLCIPSKRPPDQANLVLVKWRERGYKIAVWCDSGPELTRVFDHAHVEDYPGYSRAVNKLIQRVMVIDPFAQWFVTGGDDVYPDPNHTAEEIAEQCEDHFGGTLPLPGVDRNPAMRTFGVMQPTGDRWGDDALGRARWPDAPAYIDRVCGSPWFGREYCRRMYGGRGPLFEGYRHMFEDEEAQHVALKMGVLWQRRDLTQHHEHWMRNGDPRPSACPDFLRPVSVGIEGERHWAESKALFESRKAAGFPGHEPLCEREQKLKRRCVIFRKCCKGHPIQN